MKVVILSVKMVWYKKRKTSLQPSLAPDNECPDVRCFSVHECNIVAEDKNIPQVDHQYDLRL